MLWALPKAIHLLGAAIWVGGMFFALLVLRPSLSVLEPPQRLALHGQVFRRFFLIVWHAMPLVLLSGYFMLFTVYGGFAGASPYIHIMHLTGLIMAGVFVWIFFGPWKRFRADPASRPEAANEIRKLIMVNLVLGLFTIFIAAFA
jgi:uncharacterized membrane protein